MTPETFCQHFATFADAPDGIKKLRHLILQLAVQGKLTNSETSDGSVTVLRSEMESVRQRMIDAGTIRQGDRFEPVSVDETPYPLPANWTWARIGEAMHLINGKAFKPTDWLTSGLPIVRIQNLNNPDAPFNYAGEDVDDKVRLQNDDFLISWSGTPGTSFGAFIWDRGPAVLNQHIFRAILYGKAFIKPFLKLAVNARLDEMIAQAHGGVGLQHITKSKLERVPLPLPPLAEQRRIVEKVDQLLGLCDELAARQAAQREKRQRLVGATLHRLVSIRNPAEFPTHAHRLRNHFDQLFDTPTTIPQLRQTILQLAVQGQLVPQDPDDEPIQQTLGKVIARRADAVRNKSARRKEFDGSSDLIKADSLPKSWAVERLGNLVDPESTISYGVLVPGNDVADGVPFVRVQDLSLDSHASRPNKTISHDVEKAYSRTRLRGGEILMCVVGATIGRLGIVPDTWAGANIARAVVRIQPVSEISYEYLLIVLQTPLIKNYFRETTRTLAQPTLNVGAIEQTPIPLPPLAEQKRIVTKVAELLSLCDALEAKLIQAESASTQLLSAAVHGLLNGATTNV